MMWFYFGVIVYVVYVVKVKGELLCYNFVNFGIIFSVVIKFFDVVRLKLVIGWVLSSSYKEDIVCFNMFKMVFNYVKRFELNLEFMIVKLK